MTTIETAETDSFQLQLNVFEGPLDLLLYLIDQQELDITAVSLVQVTDQYLTYLRSGEQLDANALAEFIAIGARLLYLKSRALLPQPETDDEPDEDVGDDLLRRLREYRRYKEAAAALQDIQDTGFRAYPRLAPPQNVPLPTGLSDVTLDRMAQILREVLERKPEEEEEPGVVERREVTVEDKIEQLDRDLKAQGQVSFRVFISACRSKLEVIVSFMAVLELIKLLRLQAEQDETFADINLVALAKQPEAQTSL